MNELYSITKENGKYYIINTNGSKKVEEDHDLDFIRFRLLQIAANEFHKKAADAYEFGACLNIHYEVRDDKIYEVKNGTI